MGEGVAGRRNGGRGAAALAGLAGLILLGGCNREKATDIILSPTPTQLAVEPSAVSLPVGGTATLRAVVVPAGDNRADWSSSDPAVATVSMSVGNGVVTCVAAGSASISVVSTPNPALRATAAVTCTAPQATPQPPPGTEPPPDGLITVSPGTLRFVHDVGSSPCPQAVGEFDVRSFSAARIFVSIRSNDGAIEVEPAEFVLESGETRAVRVAFNCRRQNSFNTNIRLDANTGSGATDVDVVRVEAVIR